MAVDDVEARAAATVVVMRDAPDARSIEVLMLHRLPTASMFPDAWVFPGGAVDAADGDGDLGTRVAAARELMEESGLAVNPASLTAIAFWQPPGTGKRFNTEFFATDEFAGEVRVNPYEADGFMWIAPVGALHDHSEGRIRLAIPTWMTLSRLAFFGSTAGFLSAARHQGRLVFRSHFHTVDDGRVVLWEGDAAYESGDLDAPGPRFRLVARASGPWRLERSTD